MVLIWYILVYVWFSKLGVQYQREYKKLPMYIKGFSFAKQRF